MGGVTVSTDSTLKVWGLETALPLATFHCDARALHCACLGNRNFMVTDGADRLYFLRLVED
jgi:hypothetical protein